MKITVSDGSCQFNIRIPTGLIFNPALIKTGLRIGRHYAGDSIPPIPPEAAAALCAEIRRIRKKRGSWELVEVSSADGQHVRIIL